MTTIAYDQPVKDLIAGMNATGHVTHTTYRKTSVTLHHNAGINTHEQVLNTWKTREASAHFDSDATGAICQFVEVNEYAWAVNDTQGNMSSISIEMCNETLGPDWKVGDATWRSAARLAGWLFAKVIGQRPSSSNFFYHHHWSATACAGPYMDQIYSSVLAAAQASYDHFAGKPVTPPPPTTPSSGSGRLYQGASVPALIAQGSNQYLGSISGPAASHGGANLAEKQIVKMLQQRLIVCGFVPGVSDPNGGWADGVFDTPNDPPGTGATSQAVARFQHAHLPGTTSYGQVWYDDWTKLFNL